MKKIIYLVRHGETDYNKQGIVQGKGIDSSLNKTGKEQAHKLYHHLKDIDFDKVYVSMLKRTCETVELFTHKIPFQSFEGLDEIGWGKLEGVKSTPSTLEHFKKITDQWKNGNLNLSFEDGESPIEVMNRQKTAIYHLLKNTEEKKILICSHGRAMRIMLSWLLKKSLKDMDKFPHQNTGYYVLSYERAKFELLKPLQTSHLKNEN